MICPNCGSHYTEEEKICKKCHTPLGNAVYTPVDHTILKKRRRKHALIITALVLVFLIIGGVIGYQVYLSVVKKKCTEVTDQIFSCANDMDFSEFSSYGLPEPLKSEPNVKNLVKKELNIYIEESGLSSLISTDQIDMDTLCSEITKRASYEITDVTADYHSCTVTVSTSNLDFASLPETIYEKAASEITNTDSSLWTSIKNSIASLFGSEDTTEETSGEDFSSKIQTWLDEALDEGTRTQTTGKIVYGIKNGKWTLISFDKNLIYSYYGIKAAE